MQSSENTGLGADPVHETSPEIAQLDLVFNSYYQVCGRIIVKKLLVPYWFIGSEVSLS